MTRFYFNCAAADIFDDDGADLARVEAETQPEAEAKILADPRLVGLSTIDGFDLSFRAEVSDRYFRVHSDNTITQSNEGTEGCPTTPDRKAVDRSFGWTTQDPVPSLGLAKGNNYALECLNRHTMWGGQELKRKFLLRSRLHDLAQGLKAQCPRDAHSSPEPASKPS